MPLRRVTFNFKKEMIQRPVIYELGKIFEIVTLIGVKDASTFTCLDIKVEL